MARENWASTIGFVLASAGSAIGLGNIWKFPYMAGENGGGTFVLIYFLAVLLIGLPVMCSEMLIGRKTKRNVINAMGKIELIAPNPWVRYLLSGFACGFAVLFFSMQAWLLVVLALAATVLFAKRGFAAMGWICTGVALLILSYYAVVGGWIVEYIFRSATGTLVAQGAQGAENALSIFVSYASSPWRVLIGFLIFMGVTAWILFGGIRSGIERASKILMPSLFILLIVVIIRGVTLPGATEGIVFLLKPTTAGLTPKVILMAVGQAFFSLSLGMAITVTYGSYLSKKQNILRSAGWVGVLDSCASLFAGLAIFPAVFAAGLSPTGGPGLIFGALPATFNTMPLGSVWATCFFVMLFFAAVTSSASLLECGATVFIERFRKGRARCSRKKAVLIAMGICAVLGLLSVASTTDWSHLPWVEKATAFCMGDLTQGSWFDTVDFFASNWCLPFAALSITLLVGWCWTPRVAAVDLLAEGEPRVRGLLLLTWGFLIRWVAPVAIVMVFLSSAKIIDFGI